MIIYLNEKVNEFEIKIPITGDDFMLVTMMFGNRGYFIYLGKRTDSQCYYVKKNKEHCMTAVES